MASVSGNGFGITVEGVPELNSTLDQVAEMFFQSVQFVLEATAPYAKFVEYGTWKMRAQPYLGPGIQDAQASFSRIASGNDGSIRDIVRAMVEYAAERARQYVPVLTGFLRSTIQTREM